MSRSAVSRRYFADPFVKYFVSKPVRRSPIMNRGTYIRQLALDRLVRQFLALPSTGKKKQILSLGAGFDTRYFLLKKNKTLDDARYFETDFPETIAKKTAIIKRYPDLHGLVANSRLERGGMDLVSDDYVLVGGDLRQWPNIMSHMLDYGFDVQAPTLLISECVLIYLDPEYSNAIVDWATQTLVDCMVILYEQIRPTDAFGKMMIQVLQGRDIDLKGIHAYPELEDQKQRFLQLGWDGAKAVDLNEMHDKYLDPKDLARIARLEMLDELEEWRLLSAHYCVAWAYKSANAKDAYADIGLGKRKKKERFSTISLSRNTPPKKKT
ncbi:S-adenosyl-L-methionine-dependent methyltransferase [Dichotomocladium elegans]|nr:S-adenosyl-L-methionine-dependent methyltransferase [Dichotomocladium elegans]